jgi:hypothetical protein
MPYDPRPVSSGGNQGIDEEFSRKAPAGKFRVIGVDTFDGTDWHEKDCDSLSEAREYADEKVKGQQMLKMYVYNDQGLHRHGSGTF